MRADLSAPVPLDELKAEYGIFGAPSVVWIDGSQNVRHNLTLADGEVSEAPETAGRYDVMSVPTLVLFVSGEPTQTLVGAPPKAEILICPGATSWRVMRAGHSAPRPAAAAGETREDGT